MNFGRIGCVATVLVCYAVAGYADGGRTRGLTIEGLAVPEQHIDRSDSILHELKYPGRVYIREKLGLPLPLGNALVRWSDHYSTALSAQSELQEVSFLAAGQRMAVYAQTLPKDGTAEHLHRLFKIEGYHPDKIARTIVGQITNLLIHQARFDALPDQINQMVTRGLAADVCAMDPALLAQLPTMLAAPTAIEPTTATLTVSLGWNNQAVFFPAGLKISSGKNFVFVEVPPVVPDGTLNSLFIYQNLIPEYVILRSTKRAADEPFSSER